jgi:hypothetical protein
MCGDKPSFAAMRPTESSARLRHEIRLILGFGLLRHAPAHNKRDILQERSAGRRHNGNRGRPQIARVMERCFLVFRALFGGLGWRYSIGRRARTPGAVSPLARRTIHLR